MLDAGKAFFYEKPLLSVGCFVKEICKVGTSFGKKVMLCEDEQGLKNTLLRRNSKRLFVTVKLILEEFAESIAFLSCLS